MVRAASSAVTFFSRITSYRSTRLVAGLEDDPGHPGQRLAVLGVAAGDDEPVPGHDDDRRPLRAGRRGRLLLRRLLRGGRLGHDVLRPAADPGPGTSCSGAARLRVGGLLRRLRLLLAAPGTMIVGGALPMLFIISASASARAAALPLSIVMTRVLPPPVGVARRPRSSAGPRRGRRMIVLASAIWSGAPRSRTPTWAPSVRASTNSPAPPVELAPPSDVLSDSAVLVGSSRDERDELDGRVPGGLAAALEDGGDVEVVGRVGEDQDLAAAGQGADLDHLRRLVPGLEDLDVGVGGPGRDVVDHGTRGAADRPLLHAVRPDVDLLEHRPGHGQLVGRAGDQDGVGPLRDDDLDALEPSAGGGDVARPFAVAAITGRRGSRHPGSRRPGSCRTAAGSRRTPSGRSGPWCPCPPGAS